LIIVSSILIIIAGVVLFFKVPSLWFRFFEIESGISYGVGSMNVTDIPLFPALLMSFGVVSIILAYKLNSHLNLFACINFGVLITLSFVWLPIFTQLMYAQDYGAPFGWLGYYYHPYVGKGRSPEVGVYGLDFLIDTGFWATVVGAPYLEKKGKGLLAAGFVLGFTGYLLSLALYMIEIIDSMFSGTIHGFTYVETFLYNINSWSSSALLFKEVFIFDITSVSNLIAVVFYIVGLIGVVLTYLAWHHVAEGVKSYGAGMLGGFMMIIGSTLLFGFVGGILAIIGAVESK